MGMERATVILTGSKSCTRGGGIKYVMGKVYRGITGQELAWCKRQGVFTIQPEPDPTEPTELEIEEEEMEEEVFIDKDDDDDDEETEIVKEKNPDVIVLGDYNGDGVFNPLDVGGFKKAMAGN